MWNRARTPSWALPRRFGWRGLGTLGGDAKLALCAEERGRGQTPAMGEIYESDDPITRSTTMTPRRRGNLSRPRRRWETARRATYVVPWYKPRCVGPRTGGVPVAAAVAQALAGELDVLVVQVGSPISDELAIGAVTADGVRVVNRRIIHDLGVSASYSSNARHRDGPRKPSS